MNASKPKVNLPQACRYSFWLLSAVFSCLLVSRNVSEQSYYTELLVSTWTNSDQIQEPSSRLVVPDTRKTMSVQDFERFLLFMAIPKQQQNPDLREIYAYRLENKYNFSVHKINSLPYFPDPARKHEVNHPRKELMEWLFKLALKSLFDDPAFGYNKWPRLRSLLLNNHSVPFLFQYGDVEPKGFRYGFSDPIDNRSNRQVFLFSHAMSVDPNAPVHMAVPTYISIELAQAREGQWPNKWQLRNKPWGKKHSQAIWRGTCNNACDDGKGRWNLYQLANTTASPLLNVQFTAVQDTHHWRNLTLVHPIPMERYADYKAILDVDGNSWSGRFGTLLCLDSVVVKIEPTLVDHFWPEVQPWTHYVPVHGNLSNLLDQVRWVVRHPAESKKIIGNAKAWCRHKFQAKVLARDLLDIWESYVTNTLTM